jgi:hypothetical protein
MAVTGLLVGGPAILPPFPPENGYQKHPAAFETQNRSRKHNFLPAGAKKHRHDQRESLSYVYVRSA